MKRLKYLDILRILSAFLVIVNHTNSRLFLGSDPSQPLWWGSILWFYLCKMAVPIYVMVSGACLLGKRESLKKTAGRILRMIAVIFVFSWFYFAYDCWVNYGLWPRVFRFDNLISLIWQQKITDSFWYLCFYLGLLLALPFLQALSVSAEKKLLWLFCGLCFVFDPFWSLLVHYVPALALPRWSWLPLFNGYLGLFISGFLLKEIKSRSGYYILPVFILLMALICAFLTSIEYSAVGAKTAHCFLDSRLHPSFPVVLMSIAMFVFAGKVFVGAGSRITTEIGSCAFGIYLLQDWVIAQTETRIFNAYLAGLPFASGMLVWEILVFILCFCAAWFMRRIPLLKRIL